MYVFPVIYSHDLLILQTVIIVVRIGNSCTPCIRILQNPDPVLAKYYFALTTIRPLSWIQRLRFINNRETLTGLIRRNFPTSVRRHWQYTTLTAPSKRMNHAHPRSAASAIFAVQIYHHKLCSNSSPALSLHLPRRGATRITRFHRRSCRLAADLGRLRNPATPACRSSCKLSAVGDPMYLAERNPQPLRLTPPEPPREHAHRKLSAIYPAPAVYFSGLSG